MRHYILTAAAASALLAAVAGATIPVNAATNSLLVTAVNRAGTTVHPKVTAHNLSTNREYTVKPGTRRTLPSGHYAVLTTITTGDSSTGSITLAGRTVTVKGATKFTFDARKAHALKATLDGHDTSDQSAGICVAQKTSAIVSASASPGQLFVMGGSSSALHFQYVTTWSPTVSDVASAFVSGATKGVPASPSYSFKSASLATLKLTVQKGKVTDPNTWITMVPQGASGCNLHGSGVVSSDGYSFSAPKTLNLSLSASGWDTWLNYPGGTGSVTSGSRTYAAGKSYTLTMTRK
jgi:hypothetical protein